MWKIKFCPEAKADLIKIYHSLVKIILSGIKKVSTNPLPQSEGGYGKPLGHIGNINLTGFFKIKYRGIGIRVVYTIVRESRVMNIIVISLREKNRSYKQAQKRVSNYGHKLFKDIF